MIKVSDLSGYTEAHQDTSIYNYKINILKPDIKICGIISDISVHLTKKNNKLYITNWTTYNKNYISVIKYVKTFCLPIGCNASNNNKNEFVYVDLNDMLYVINTSNNNIHGHHIPDQYKIYQIYFINITSSTDDYIRFIYFFILDDFTLSCYDTIKFYHKPEIKLQHLYINYNCSEYEIFDLTMDHKLIGGLIDDYFYNNSISEYIEIIDNIITYLPDYDLMILVDFNDKIKDTNININ